MADEEKDLESAEVQDTEEVVAEEAVAEENTEETAQDLSTALENEAEYEKEETARWYVVHTYSGYENKVKVNLEKAIENRHLENQILEVRVPMEESVEIRNGVQKSVTHKMFPGYVLVYMDMNDETWYVVRNTRGVTGFVGPGSKPVPLSDAEIKALGIKNDVVSVDFGVGDEIAVVAGVWKDTVGVVTRMDISKQVATINVDLFGRSTPVEISFSEVRKTSN